MLGNSWTQNFSVFLGWEISCAFDLLEEPTQLRTGVTAAAVSDLRLVNSRRVGLHTGKFCIWNQWFMP